jgi:tetratricopeptide (TPR) repeat protein
MTLREANLLRLLLAWLVVGVLSACTSGPKTAPEPYLRTRVLEAQNAGSRQFARADYAAALPQFTQAWRLAVSLDDTAAAARNQYNVARTELAMGRVQTALSRASEIDEPSVRVEAHMLRAQIHLSMGQWEQARSTLSQLALSCPGACPYAASVGLLHARLALGLGQWHDAANQARAVIPLLHLRQEDVEQANAWRLLASAQRRQGETAAALESAKAALALDRKLALPEKIVRDWMLIGDIHGTTYPSQARESYQRALTVAQAARIESLIVLAQQAIQENSP